MFRRNRARVAAFENQKTTNVAMPKGSTSANEAKRLRREVSNAIGSHLQALYQDSMRAPMPDRFIRLLRTLDETDDRSAPGANPEDPNDDQGHDA
jgi:hypothetical protein